MIKQAFSRIFITIPLILILFVLINSALVIDPSSSASVAMPVQGQPFFSINSIEVTEGAGAQAVFSVSLTYQGSFREFSSSVNYAALNGTATSPADYQQASGIVNFPPGPGGTVSMTVSIPIVDDSETEGDESFTIVLNNPSPAFALSPATGTCTIHDNDGGPSGLVILDAEVVEGDGGTTDAVFRVGLNGSSNSAVSVDFATENFSAVAGSDYLSRTGTLTIPAGQRSANITVPIIGDTLPELTQGFFVRLSNARGASIADGEAAGVIVDDDDPERITVCSSDTPKQGQEVRFLSRIESTLRIDRDLMIDDMDVRLFISNQTDSFFGNLLLSADLMRDPAGTGERSSSLFRILTLLPQSTIGTRCSPTPDFTVTDNGARRLKDHNGEAPYAGEWRDADSRGFSSEGFNARGGWRLEIRGSFANTVFSVRNAHFTLECWCLSVAGPREGLRLEPSRATLPVFEGNSEDINDVDGDLKKDEIVIQGGHTVEATVNSSSGPVEDVPVTFTIRDKGGQGDVLVRAVRNTNFRGRAYYHYLDWVPGEQTIEARAEVNGAIYTDIARVTWINPCAVTQTVQGAAGADTTLAELRGFRDSRLARSKRGRDYSRLYYKFSSEAIRLMMFNPMMVLRSQEMIERYMPVIRDLSAGRSAVLTEGDLNEIDAFMNDFAAAGSAELQQTVKSLSRDLRDPEAHRDLGITLRPGPRREMPSHNRLQGFKQIGELTALLGFFLGGVFLIRWGRGKGVRMLLCVALAIPGIASGNLPRAVAAIQGQTDSRPPEYSTYFGGSGSDQGTAVTADAEGNIYIAGITDSTNLPTMSAAQAGFGGGGQDAFVAKFDPSGTRLVYLTYLGGSGSDTATGLSVDSSGNAYITGFTTSTDFPTLNALQPNNRGQFNGFVTKLAPAGNLVYSTYLGGTVNDSASGIAVDASGNAYVAGIATSPNFPTVNALQPNLSGAADVYVARLNAAGNQLIYSTFLGGSREDAATAVAVDPSGNLYVTGATLSTDLRIVNAVQSAHGGGIFDAFVMKLNPSGTSLVYSTYLGGGGAERGFRIAADSSGNAYVVGDTFSTDFPTANALQQQAGGSADAFVAKLNANGTLAYSTYLGGSGIDGGAAIAVDPSGDAFVTGFTESRNFPAAAALQPEFGGGGFDAFIAKLNPSGTALEFSTYLGGSGTDSGFGIVASTSNSAYAIGLTGSGDFATMNPIQPGFGGGISDVFMVRIRLGPTITGAEIKGKHLNIAGSGFEQGAVILMDGAQQKTLFKSGSSLRGKKVGRKINPGQTVRLQVRNPDGSVSSDFSFTRAAQ